MSEHDRSAYDNKGQSTYDLDQNHTDPKHREVTDMLARGKSVTSPSTPDVDRMTAELEAGLAKPRGKALPNQSGPENPSVVPPLDVSSLPG